jgi:hypothetical protein
MCVVSKILANPTIRSPTHALRLDLPPTPCRSVSDPPVLIAVDLVPLTVEGQQRHAGRTSEARVAAGQTAVAANRLSFVAGVGLFC